MVYAILLGLNLFLARDVAVRPMSILVTGGSGFIGRHFCESAIARGAQVTVLTRDRAKAARFLPRGVSLYENLNDIGNEEIFDIVVNLAGEPLGDNRWTAKRKKLFIDSRVGITERLLTFFGRRESRPKHVISGSAVGYYGHSSVPLDESSSGSAGFSHQLCRSWEDTALGFESLGSRVCLLRTGIVLGESGALARMLPAFRMGLGGPLGDGGQYMSWIHRDDMISLINHCIEDKGIRGPVNATAPNPVTNREFASMLGATLRRPANIRMPSVMAKALFGEMANELLLNGQRILPTVVLEGGFVFRFPNLESALVDLLE